MQCKIKYQREYDKALLFTIDKLPCDFSEKLESFLEKNDIYTVNEIRIRASSFVCLMLNGKSLKTDIFVSENEIEKIVLHLCDGSIYAHLSTIKEGYISVGKGIRAGICGKAVITNGEIDGIYDISSVCIRIPQKIKRAGEFLFDYLKKHEFRRSVILYSPPGVGKTTVLRDLTLRISTEQVRCSVIDTREEITTFLEASLSCDVFLSYPKSTAIEMATRTLTPQIILCDEITSLKEAEAIKHSVNSGVSLVATTHASSFDELSSKEILKGLFACGAFDTAIGISRGHNNKFIFEVNDIK